MQPGGTCRVVGYGKDYIYEETDDERKEKKT